jgi:hypothetical protein
MGIYKSKPGKYGQRPGVHSFQLTGRTFAQWALSGWLILTVSAIIFGILATVLMSFGVSQSDALVVSFVVSTAILIVSHMRLGFISFAPELNQQTRDADKIKEATKPYRVSTEKPLTSYTVFGDAYSIRKSEAIEPPIESRISYTGREIVHVNWSIKSLEKTLEFTIKLQGLRDSQARDILTEEYNNQTRKLIETWEFLETNRREIESHRWHIARKSDELEAALHQIQVMLRVLSELVELTEEAAQHTEGAAEFVKAKLASSSTG